MRWLAELRNPALHCERVGHAVVGEWRRGYVRGSGGYFGGVATRLRQEREVCSRCGVEIEPWRSIEGHSHTISSLSASADAWDKIDAGGWWPDSGRCARPPAKSDATSPSAASAGKDALDDPFQHLPETSESGS